MKSTWYRRVMVVATLLGLMATLVPSTWAEPATFNDPNMQIVWERTDKPVEMFVTARSYMWGPNTLPGSPSTEPYANSPGGQRTVQYFDKSRMEVNNPSGDRTNLFFITNGLLVREMVSGERQFGDDQFLLFPPALESVAGDPATVNPNSPTYATFRNLASLNNDNPSPDRTGQAVVESISISSTITTITSPDPSVNYVSFNGNLKHNIPNKFNDFLNQMGPIFVNGAIEQNQPVINPVFLAGFPITEAYWVKTLVAGAQKDVLVQLYERRVLTYTPSNPAGFQVEMGNVGQHYFRWRYGGGPKAEERIVFQSDRTGGVSQISSMNTDGSDVQQLTTTGPNFAPRWSPDNLHIAFRSQRTMGSDEIWMMNADGSNQTKVTPGPFDSNPDWSADGTRIFFENGTGIASVTTTGGDLKQLTTGPDSFPRASPDGTKVAFSRLRSGTTIGSPVENEVFSMNVDGTNQTKLTSAADNVHQQPTDWKDNKILFQTFTTAITPTQIWVMNADGSNQTKISGDTDQAGSFSPDLSRIALVRGSFLLGGDVFIENADGSNPQQLSNTTTGNFSPDWSN